MSDTDAPTEIGFDPPMHNGAGVHTGEALADHLERHAIQGLADRMATLEDKIPQVTALLAQQAQDRQYIAELQQAVRHLLGQQSQSETQLRIAALDLGIKAAGAAADFDRITLLAGGFLMWLKAPATQPAATGH